MATPFDVGTSIPNLSVLEFAVLIAVFRKPGILPEQVRLKLSHWFVVEVAPAEISRAGDRLLHRGYIEPRGDGWNPVPRLVDDAARLLGGMIRLIDDDRQRFDVALLSKLASQWGDNDEKP